MHRLTQKLMAALLALGAAMPAEAGELESKVATAALSEFAKEQLKYELATFLNHNPNIVGSTNPRIGSMTVKWLSKAIAAYNLLSAKTDRDRSWAATYLILSPEPVTAAILFGVQLVDTVLNLRAHRDNVRIYVEAMEIQARAFSIYAAASQANMTRLTLILNQWSAALESIKSNLKFLNQHPVTLWLEAPTTNAQQVTEDQIADLLTLLLELRQNLTALDAATIMLDSSPVLNDLRITNQTYDGHRRQVNSLHTSILKIFASLRSQTLLSEMQSESDFYSRQMRAYQYCAELERTQVRVWLDRQVSPESLSVTFLKNCRERIEANGDYL